jgi:aminoglycoside phosphotransferase family enzyme
MCSFIDITHTSKLLRRFTKVNAGRMSDEAIRSRQFVESELLKSKLVEGWLVPTHEERKDLNCFHYKTSYKGPTRQGYLDKHYDGLRDSAFSETV